MAGAMAEYVHPGFGVSGFDLAAVIMVCGTICFIGVIGLLVAFKPALEKLWAPPTAVPDQRASRGDRDSAEAPEPKVFLVINRCEHPPKAGSGPSDTVDGKWSTRLSKCLNVGVLTATNVPLLDSRGCFELPPEVESLFSDDDDDGNDSSDDSNAKPGLSASDANPSTHLNRRLAGVRPLRDRQGRAAHLHRARGSVWSTEQSSVTLPGKRISAEQGDVIQSFLLQISDFMERDRQDRAAHSKIPLNNFVVGALNEMERSGVPAARAMVSVMHLLRGNAFELAHEVSNHTQVEQHIYQIDTRTPLYQRGKVVAIAFIQFYNCKHHQAIASAFQNGFTR